MARKVDRVRPRAEREPSADVELEALSRRQARRVLEHAPRPHDPPRRLNGSGLVVVYCVVICLVLYVLSAVSAHLGGHR